MNFPRDARQYAPATERNREPILRVLEDVLPATGTILEIASGTGEHAAFLAPRLHPRRWLPSDVNPVACASIAAWRDQVSAPNLYPPIRLNVSDRPWPIEQDQLPETLQKAGFQCSDIVAIVNINMIHIAPWDACLALLEGAGRLLPAGGILYLYGPFRQHRLETALSNEAFDRSLREQNSAWGLRYLEDVIEIAKPHNLTFIKTVEMPANNLSVIFQAS
jgi:SAM-dependent methyltransferase